MLAAPLDYNSAVNPSTLTLRNILPSIRACSYIMILDDEEVEVTEQFEVRMELSNSFGNFSLTAVETTVFIEDNDVVEGIAIL